MPGPGVGVRGRLPRRTRCVAALVLVLAGGASGGCGGGSESEPARSGLATSAPTGEPAPAWDLARVRGGRLALDDLRGRAVVLDFWATWCVPCIEAIPELNELHAEYEDRLAVVGVSVDTLEDDALLAWVEDGELHDPIWYELVRGDMALAERYGAFAFPHTVLISAEGELLETLEPGMQTRVDLENALRKHGQL